MVSNDSNILQVPSLAVVGNRNPTAERLLQIHAVQEELTSSHGSHDKMELSIATATSLDFSREDDSPMVWTILADPPSSDKTQTVAPLRNCGVDYFLDNLTSKAFISGFIDPKTGQPTQDLLPDLDGKCLILKDMTSLFSEREETVKAVLGALQSIYDGSYTRATGTGVRGYDSRFTFLGCVTPITLSKHQRYLALIGSRFLIHRGTPLTNAEELEGFERIWDTTRNRADLIKDLNQLVREHVEDILTSPVILKPESVEVKEVINRLAKLVARGRTTVRTERVDGSLYTASSYELAETQTEQPWRLTFQFRNLARALTRVHGRIEVTPHELELVRKVALGTIQVGRSEVLKAFQTHPNGMTANECSDTINKSYTWALHRLNELETIGLVSKQEGQQGDIFILAPEYRDLITTPLDTFDHSMDLLR